MGLSLADIVRCPTCHSAAVVYSCEPKCCFNHVCGDCRTSFQLLTAKTGRFDRDNTIVEAAEPGSSDPTAACAACEGLRLAVVSSAGENQATLLCGDCHALLELAIEDLAPGS